MERSKIQLSQYELTLVQNPDILLTKNLILQKVCDLFAFLAERFQSRVKQSSTKLIQESGAVLPKISRGENYKGLPYIMLDYPRNFTREDVFAVRTMFWWGNFFSITLHLKGEYLMVLRHHLLNSPLLQDGSGFLVSCTGDEWEHDAAASSYHPRSSFDNPDAFEKLRQSAFMKVSTILPLNNWATADEFLYGNFEKIMELIEI